MNTLIAIVSFFALMAVWSLVWKKTYLDTSRDRLFDIRDETRAWFLENGYSLDNDIYCVLRSTINAYIFHADSINILKFLFVHTCDGACRDELDIHIEDEKLANFAKNTRESAAFVMLDYMILTNPFTATLAAIMFPFALLYACGTALLKTRLFNFGVKKAACFAAICGMLWSIPTAALTSAPILSRYINMQRVECYTTQEP